MTIKKPTKDEELEHMIDVAKRHIEVLKGYVELESARVRRMEFVLESYRAGNMDISKVKTIVGILE